ncbi:MAG: LacI family transcriptional regulator [Oscillospiraceae bacterium]|nr:LacI family transcriptional regulator [Oscillospiraceae bacterium]
MAITIQDIAERVGVNPSTVSRAISGKAPISAKTRARINAVMVELDYHPNGVARSLVSGISEAIGIAMDARDNQAYANPFFSLSLFAIEKIAQEKGYNVIISNCADGRGQISPVEKLMRERKVDGLILPPSTITAKLVERMDGMKFPYVILGEPDLQSIDACSPATNINWVDVNNVQGSELAVGHLLEQGYRSIAFLGGAERLRFAVNRVKGYRRALENMGAAPLVLPTDGTAHSAQSAVEAALTARNCPDAFLCHDNLAAFGALGAIRAAGLSVPRDIGLVTFDNEPLAPFMQPQLTAIDVNTGLLGEQAAELLFQQISRPGPARQVLLSVALIRRESTDRGVGA